MNQITLSAADLKLALPGLSKVVSRKTTLPVLQSVRLTRTEAGIVTLSATPRYVRQLQPRTLAKG